MKKIYRLLTDLIVKFPGVVLTLVIFLTFMTIFSCYRNKLLKSKINRYEPKITSKVVVKSKTADRNGKEVVQSTEIKTTEAEYSKIPSYTGKVLPKEILFWDSDDISHEDSKNSQRSGIISSDISSIIEDTSKPIPVVLTKSLDQSLQQQPVNLNEKNFYFNEFTNISSPEQDSLIQFLLDRNNLELSFYNSEYDKFFSKTYDINLEKYKYNWTLDNGLSSQPVKLLELRPYAKVDYRLFNKIISIGGGLNLRTRNLDYNLGINLSYDKNDSKFKPDVEIGITYKFKKWLEK